MGRLPLAALIFGVALCAWTFRCAAIDDAFITYRYAANTWNHHAAVYNLDEWVLGTTTPLWTYVLALVYGSGIDLVRGSQAVTLALWCVIAWMVAGCAQCSSARNSSAGLIVTLTIFALAFYYPIYLSLGSGMETIGYSLAVLVTMSAAVKGRGGAAGIGAGVSLWLRPDGIICAIVSAAVLAKDVRQLIRCFGIFVILGVAYAFHNFYLYGAWLPHSVVAKQALYPVPAVKNILMVLEGFQQNPFDAVLFCAGIAGFVIGRANAYTRACGMWTALYLIGLGASGVKPIFYWYFVPVWFILLAVGLPGLLNIRFGPALVSVVLGATLVSSSFELRRPQPSYERELIYRTIVEDFGSQIAAGDRVLLAETGIMGFGFLSTYVCDSAGIVSPPITEVIKQMRREVGGEQGLYGDISAFSGWLRRMIEVCRPTWIIGPRGRMDLLVTPRDPWFKERYERAKLYPEGHLGGVGVFRRRGE